MFSWKLEKIDLPLKFKGNFPDFRKNFVVTIGKDGNEGRGEVAWSARFNESEKKITQAFEQFCGKCPKDIAVLQDFLSLFDEIEIPNSLKCGIESAYIQLLAKISNKPIQKIIGVNTVRSVATSFSLPNMAMEEVDSFIQKHDLRRFVALKITLSGEPRDRELLKIVSSSYPGKLRLDAKESFGDSRDFLNFIEDFIDYPIEFVEQPFCASGHKHYLELKKKSPFPIFADESLSAQAVTDYFSDHFHGVNVKLMKSGGHFKAIRQMKQARDRGLEVQLGCMLESSLGVSAGLAIASRADYINLDGHLLLERDPWQLILEENGKIFFADMH